MPPDRPPKPAAESSPARQAASGRRRARVGTVFVGGHFDPAVARSLRIIAATKNTTVQALIGRALNDLLEANGHGRPASEEVLPRGSAARRRDEDP